MQFRAELAQVDAQIGLNQIVFAQSGEIGDSLGHGDFFAGGKLASLEERGGVIALRVFARVLDKSREISGAILQEFVVPSRGRVTR